MQRKFLDYNTLQYTLADPRFAVSHHSDDYSGHYGGATLVTAYRGTARAEPRYAVDYYTDDGPPARVVNSSPGRTISSTQRRPQLDRGDLRIPNPFIY